MLFYMLTLQTVAQLKSISTIIAIRVEVNDYNLRPQLSSPQIFIQQSSGLFSAVVVVLKQ